MLLSKYMDITHALRFVYGERIEEPNNTEQMLIHIPD